MSTFTKAAFLGVDLGWYGKPSGLASIAIDREGLSLRDVTRLEGTDDILRWIKSEAGGGSAVVAVDAPIVIRNRIGIRDAERELNREFRRYHAGCHAANLGRPFAEKVLSYSRRLETLGFGHRAELEESIVPKTRKGCIVKVAVEIGKPYQQIIQLALEAQTDLVIMGARGRGALDTAIFGSTTYRVIQLGSCPVLAVHI